MRPRREASPGAGTGLCRESQEDTSQERGTPAAAALSAATDSRVWPGCCLAFSPRPPGSWRSAPWCQHSCHPGGSFSGAPAFSSSPAALSSSYLLAFRVSRREHRPFSTPSVTLVIDTLPMPCSSSATPVFSGACSAVPGVPASCPRCAPVPRPPLPAAPGDLPFALSSLVRCGHRCSLLPQLTTSSLRLSTSSVLL